MRLRTGPFALALAAVAASFAAFSGGSATATLSDRPDRPAMPTPAAEPEARPTYDHVVLVVFENKAQRSIIGNPSAPYINTLAEHGANFTASYAVTHPSQPNYLALFSGSTQGVTGDTCPHTFKADNEAHELLQHGLTFTSYAEDLPEPGSKVCTSGEYARKHAPWTNFPNVPDGDQQPWTAFPSDFAQLPTVSWVIPNLCDDMHDCSIATGDAWLKANLGGYVTWARQHNSALIVTFDENDGSAGNQIATVIVGARVKPGDYDEPITHYSVLRLVEDMYGLKRLGYAASANAITRIWR